MTYGVKAENFKALNQFFNAGDGDFLSLLHSEAVVQFPGPVTSIELFYHWLRRHDARTELVHIVLDANANRGAAEYLTRLHTEGRPIALPLAVAMDGFDDKILQVRGYHSTWPLGHSHAVRSPVLPGDRRVLLPPVVQAYHLALETGDTEQALRLFAPHGSVREPSGGISGGNSPVPLQQFFARAFQGGGIGLQYVTFFDGNHSLAAEYICDRWGKQSLPPQAGMEFWDLDESGLFTSVRIYDDIAQPQSDCK